MSTEHQQHTVTCPDCKTKLPVYDTSGTEAIACPQCLAMLRENDRGAFQTGGRVQKARTEPVIALGAEGVLEGVLYRVICYAERKDEYGSIWREYILFNQAAKSYAFLSEYDGHWNLLLPLNKSEVREKEMEKDELTIFREETYKLYSKYNAGYLHMRGEFHWPVYTDKQVSCREYIRPPFMLAREKTGAEVDYFFGSYLHPSKIKKAFGLSGLPYRNGVGVTQPFYGGIKVGNFAIGALAFIILICALNGLFNMQSKQQQVFSHTFAVDDSTINKPIVSPSFTLSGRQSNLLIDAYAKVENSWVEADVSLVNEDSHEERGFATGVDYYSGVDDGESWAEGSWSKEEVICAVKPGNYHFVIIPGKDPSGRPTSMTLQATWDVQLWWNAVLVAIVMGVITFILYMTEHYFEQRRWSSSDYSPYASEEDE
jgi:ribosomal protein S27E